MDVLIWAASMILGCDCVFCIAAGCCILGREAQFYGIVKCKRSHSGVFAEGMQRLTD